MASPKSIILTGASRGMGLAMSHFLLKAGHKLLLVARTPAPLENLKKEYPGQVEVVAADMADFSTSKKIVDTALSAFSQIDGLIINHGTLGAVKRIAEATAEEWRSTFDTNFFSTIAIVQATLPSLRNSKGKIVLVSSGASTGTYATWGAYGASKAAMNHLAMTLAVEEPEVTTVSIRPGVVDTSMQEDIRNVHSKFMDEKDTKKFGGLHKEGKLLRPEQPGNVMARLVLEASKDLSGKFLSWNDKELEPYQDM